LNQRGGAAVGFVGLEVGLNEQVSHDDAVHRLQHRRHPLGLCSQQQAKRDWQRQHPMAHVHARDDVIHQVGSRLRHAPGAAMQTQKTVGRDAAFEAGVERLFDELRQAGSGCCLGLLEEGGGVLLHQAVKRGLFGAVVRVVNRGAVWRPACRLGRRQTPCKRGFRGDDLGRVRRRVRDGDPGTCAGAWRSDTAPNPPALAHGSLSPCDVGYINAHGTGTLANDKTETKAIHAVFGEHAQQLGVSSTKSMHGHALGAGGAIELVAVIGALRDGVLPPTINYTEADPDCDLNVVPNVAHEARVEAALSNSFAFGGLNAVLALRRWA